MSPISQRHMHDRPQLSLPPAYEEAKAIRLDPSMPTSPQSSAEDRDEAGPPNRHGDANDRTEPAKPHIIYPAFEVHKARRQRAASLASISTISSRPPSPAPSPRPRPVYEHRPDWKLRLVLGLVRAAEVTNAPWMFGNGH